MSKLTKFIDGFRNIIKGIGGERDYNKNTYFENGIRINRQLAESIYTYNWLAGKCIDIPVDDATRKWRELLIEDDKKKEQVEDVMKYYDIKGKVNTAMKWARVYGGAALIFVFDNQDLTDPLEIKKISKESLKNILVLDKYELVAHSVDRNILSPNFGKPEFYTINRTGDIVHYTRTVIFQGFIPSLKAWERENFWGLSYFTKGYDPIKSSQMVSENINLATYEANVDVYRINGLNSMVAEGDDATVIKRLQIAHEMKSVVNGMALDKEDEYEKKGNNFTNLAEIDDRFIQKVAGAWNIPVTRLLGISPAGMNSTGESDMLNYYDTVQSNQENEIRPKLDQIDAIIMASEFGEFEPIEYKFNPLKQLTELEQADVDFKNSQRDSTYEGMGVVNYVDIQAQLAQKGTYVTIDEERVENEKKELEEIESLELEEPEFEPEEELEEENKESLDKQ